MIIATGDVHLGYRYCDRATFSRFLDWVSEQDGVTDFVLAGDILDLWRRDMVGVTMESAPIIAKIIALQKSGMHVHYIAGNHDYSVRHLDLFPTRFDFSTKVELMEDDVKYTFIHGWELDQDQDPIYFDALCYSNDKWGRVADRVWDVYSKYISPLVYPLAWLRQWATKKEIEQMMRTPEERGCFTPADGETLHRSATMEGEVLVCGHTHIPCIVESENRCNCGSWCTDSPVHDTFIMIDGNEVELRRFK